MITDTILINPKMGRVKSWIHLRISEHYLTGIGNQKTDIQFWALQHIFLRGHLSKYWTGLMLLTFGDCMRSSVPMWYRCKPTITRKWLKKQWTKNTVGYHESFSCISEFWSIKNSLSLIHFILRLYCELDYHGRHTLVNLTGWILSISWMEYFIAITFQYFLLIKSVYRDFHCPMTILLKYDAEFIKLI